MVVFTGRKIAYFLLCLLLLWLTLIGGVYLFQEAIIFQGQILPEDYAFELGGDFVFDDFDFGTVAQSFASAVFDLGCSSNV